MTYYNFKLLEQRIQKFCNFWPILTNCTSNESQVHSAFILDLEKPIIDEKTCKKLIFQKQKKFDFFKKKNHQKGKLHKGLTHLTLFYMGFEMTLLHGGGHYGPDPVLT